MYSVEYTRNAAKQLAKLPKPVLKAVRAAIEKLAQSPAHAANVKALKGEKNAYRLRVGDYRVIYSLDHGKLLIVVIKIGHRKDVYQ